MDLEDMDTDPSPPVDPLAQFVHDEPVEALLNHEVDG